MRGFVSLFLGHRYVSSFDIHNAYFDHLILMIFQHTVSVLEWVFQYMHISNAIVRTFTHIWHHSWRILRLGKQVCLILLCLSFVIFQRFSRSLNSSISINDFIQNMWHEDDQSILNSLYYILVYETYIIKQITTTIFLCTCLYFLLMQIRWHPC